MRTREEIEKEALPFQVGSYSVKADFKKLQLEVLLDIRDLLTKK